MKPLPSYLTLQAALSISPAEGGGPRRFTMVAYDGGRLKVDGPPAPVVVDLTGLTTADQVKALLHHDTSRPVGHMTRVEVTDRITVEGVLSVPANAGEVIEAQRNGFDWEASIGCTELEYEPVPRGRTVMVNGRTFTGPVIVARKSRLREVSFVGAGAGENTSATIAASAAVPFKDDARMADTVVTTDENRETPVAPTPDPAVEELKGMVAKLQASVDGLQKENETLKAQRLTAEQEQAGEQVETLAASLGVDVFDSDLVVELKAKAKKGELTAMQAENALLRASASHKLSRHIPAGSSKDGPALPKVIEASLCLTAGWGESDLGRHFDEKTINASLDNRWKGFGLRSLAVEYLRARGHHCIGGRLDDDDIRTAIHFAEGERLQASGAFSTLSLPGILSNVARKELLRGYEAVDGVIMKIAKRATTTDYKPFYMYRFSTAGLLEQVGPDGELKHIKLKEDEYTSRVYPFGRSLAITNVMFRNDDMGAFTELPRLFGITAKRTIEKYGFQTLLSDQSNFWTTGKANRVASGGGSALSLESLGSAYKLFLEAKDSAGEPIHLVPKYLLTAPRDAVQAANLHKSTTLNLAVAGDTDAYHERAANNPFAGMFAPLHSPYLANNQVTNANGTQWLMCGDPAIAAPIVAAFLDGREAPQIKTWEAIPGRLGMQWDVSLDFGFNLHDDKAAVYSPGA